MNPTRSRCFHKTALALAALMLVVTGAAWGQPTPGQVPGSFSNDGVRQTATGDWVMPYDECSWDINLDSYVTQATCEAAGGSWDPQALTGSACYYVRPECLKNIFYGVSKTPPNPNIDLYPGAVDTQAECEGYGHEWRDGSSSSAGACSDGESRNESSCEGIAGNVWYAPACRAKFDWDTFAYTYDDPTLSNYNDCTRCHNTRHYPKGDETHHYHGGERSVGETYAKTGHKNMVRPAAPDNLDPHYIAGAPWLDKTGAEVMADSNGNAIDWTTGTIATSGGVKDLFWIYDWMDAAPRSFYDGGGNYSCASCHTTGYEASPVDATSKQPYIMFGDTDPGSASTTGTWDQFGIQCSRCHGSRLIQDASGISPSMGDMRHHPNVAPDKAATDGGYANQGFCNADGLTWAEFGSTKRCYDPAIVSSGACATALGSWDSTNSVCYYSMLASGATRTNLCMDCHKNAQPTQNLVGSSHGHLDFIGHWKGNQFLNSPHARFLGTDSQVGDKSKYDTHFQFEGESYPYDNTVRNKGLAGGCTECHDVHKSSLADANPEGGAIVECSECHTKTLSAMLHPAGKDTPLEQMAMNPNHACETCHMPNAYHLFRINVDPNYRAFPDAVFTAGTPPATEAVKADHEGYDAVWVDLDMACGQCHGGGSEYKLTSGSMTNGTSVVTVADATGFAKGEAVAIHGAGAGGSELHGYIAEVVGNDVTLTLATAGTTVSGVEVELNPPAAGIGYISRANLAGYAKGIHNDAPKVNFTYTLNGADTLTVNFNANATTCSGSVANCNVFAWDFGDGQTGTGGPIKSHTYAAAGNYTVELTVTQYGTGSGSKSKVVTTYQPDYPPTVDSTCDWDADSWTMTLTDDSTDDIGIQQTAVTWGDGSLTSVGAQGTVFTHTYTKTGTFTVTEKVADTKGQLATFVCNPAPTASYFNISGKVTANDGSTALSNVKVQLFKDGTILVKNVYTNISGDYVAGTLKPGSYTPVFSRNGYSFPAQAPIVVGPSSVLNVSANP